MSTDKEQQFCQIADKLIADFKLQRDKRMVIIATDNIGDFYFLVSALDYVQIKYDVTFFIACRSGSKSHKILKAFQSGGGNIHIITLPINLCTLYFSLSESTILKYDRIIMDLEHSKAYPQLWHWMASRETKENLAHPEYNYNLSGNLHLTQEDGQKTVFIIPHSNFHGTPDLSFWRTICKTFKLLKFNLIINSNPNIDYGSDITYIFPPLDQIVPFANQCSLVFGIRTGLIEAVAAETKTKMVIINSGKEIENDYPHITPGKISYWPIKCVRSSCFQYIDNLIDIHAKSLLPDFKYYTSNNIIFFEKLYNAKVLTYLWAMTKKPFQFYDQSYHITKNFCFITYSLMQDRAFCLCKYAIQPALDYEIHACLKDAATGDIIAEQHFIRCNPLVFAVPRSGSFRIYMKIYHPDNYRYCCFESEPFNLTLSPLAALTSINEFQAYMRQLDSIKKECVILVVSRDAHTRPNSGRELYLAPLGARLEPEKRFRQSWLLVVDAGKAVVELADEAREVRTEYAWGANRARLASAGYNVHMNGKAPVSIEINGVEAAVNGRGLNIVVWDRERDVLLDSVVFDTYQPEAPMTRIKREFMVL